MSPFLKQDGKTSGMILVQQESAVLYRLRVELVSLEGRVTEVNMQGVEEDGNSYW